MAISVDVAKDPKAIKPKFIGFLTKRQVVCFSIAALCGIPFYLLVKNSVGTDIAVLLMIAVMLPFFLVIFKAFPPFTRIFPGMLFLPLIIAQLSAFVLPVFMIFM